MFNLPIPVTSHEDAYARTIGVFRKNADRRPFLEAAPQVNVRCQVFNILASITRFDLARGTTFGIPGLGADAMATLYDAQFTNRAGTRALRNSIRNASANNLCPYCGEGTVSELDHYLPKSSFAGITVHPANLVPTCKDCNKAKREYAPDSLNAAVLHPYFDTAFSERWLAAALVQSPSGDPVFEFSAHPNTSNSALQARLDAHLTKFDLYSRFANWAAQALSDFEFFLSTPLGAGTTLEKARKHLESNACEHSGGRINAWERAAYEAMAASDWYLRIRLGLR